MINALFWYTGLVVWILILFGVISALLGSILIKDSLLWRNVIQAP